MRCLGCLQGHLLGKRLDNLLFGLVRVRSHFTEVAINSFFAPSCMVMSLLLGAVLLLSKLMLFARRRMRRLLRLDLLLVNLRTVLLRAACSERPKALLIHLRSSLEHRQMLIGLLKLRRRSSADIKAAQQSSAQAGHHRHIEIIEKYNDNLFAQGRLLKIYTRQVIENL